jgi:hypothetical protein
MQLMELNNLLTYSLIKDSTFNGTARITVSMSVSKFPVISDFMTISVGTVCGGYVSLTGPSIVGVTLSPPSSVSYNFDTTNVAPMLHCVWLISQVTSLSSTFFSPIDENSCSGAVLVRYYFTLLLFFFYLHTFISLCT